MIDGGFNVVAVVLNDKLIFVDNTADYAEYLLIREGDDVQ